MSIYGEFDDRFRPRPTWVRLTVIAVCQFLLASLLASLCVSQIQMTFLRMAKVREAWIVYGPPWDSLETRLALRAPVAPSVTSDTLSEGSLSKDDDARPFAVRYETVRGRYGIWACAGFLALAAAVFWFVPWGDSLAPRFFANILGQTLAVFGVVGIVDSFRPETFIERWGTAPLGIKLLPLAVLAALWLALQGASAVTEQLAGMFAFGRVGRRLALWSATILPGTLIVGLFSWVSAFRPGVVGSITIAVVALFASIRERAQSRLQPRNAQMKGVLISLLVVTTLSLAGVVYCFGLPGAASSQALVIVKGHPTVRSWPSIRQSLGVWQAGADLPDLSPAEATSTAPKSLDIHWSGHRKRRK